MLLSKGGNVNIKDNEGSTPYDLCDHFTLYLIKLHCQNEDEQAGYGWMKLFLLTYGK